MKKTYLKYTSAALLSFGLMMIAFTGLAFAQNDLLIQDKNDAEFQGEGTKFEGTWNVRVTIRNCATGDVIRSFDSVTMFMSGGTLMDSTSGIPQALKTPGQGVWSHILARTYKFSFKAFNFDTMNNFTGWTIVRQTAVLDRRGNEYESNGTSEVYTPNGVLVATGCSTTTAARFE